MSIAPLLTMLDQQEPDKIMVNHVFVGDFEGSVAPLTVEHLPYFTAQFAGYVEVEFFLNSARDDVIRLSIRQAAMTFEELEDNGEVLPSLTIDPKTLKEAERERLRRHAMAYVEKGRMFDKERGESLLTEYVGKSMFNPRRFGASKSCLQLT
jgi:hypothetical protein